MRILVINPGSTSTKIAVFDDEKCLFQRTIRHPDRETAEFERVADQYGYRLKEIEKALGESGHHMGEFTAIAARGGLLKPLEGGTYLVDSRMCRDLAGGLYGDHASNLGPIIAYNLSREYNIPAYIVDPVTVDELEGPARFSGLPDIPRISRFHALNLRAVAREASARLGMPLEKINLVMAHLGSGTSVAAVRRGRMVDVSDPNSEGPFSIERCGSLPSSGLVELCYSGKYTESQIKSRLTREGGVYAYLGARDFSQVEERVARGDRTARAVVEAMCYQVAKEIGAMSTVLYGEVDAIVLTGGMANSRLVVDDISARVSSISRVLIIPGEKEMEALAGGAARVIKGEEEARRY